MDKLTWFNITVKLGDLKPWAENPKYSTKAQAERIIKSFEKFGQVQTVAVSPSLEVYDGHQRLSALLTLYGADHTIDARQSNRPLTEAERKELVITLHTAAIGSYDWQALSGWDVKELKGWGMDADALKGWNNDANNLKEMLASDEEEPQDAEPQIDRAAELLKKWKCQRGQTWLLGNFGKLYCGDAASANIKCNFSVYDPPYEWETRQQENALLWVDWENCLLMGLVNAMPIVQRSDYNHWWIWDTGMARFGGKGYKPMSGCAIMINFGDKRRWNDDAVNVLQSYGIEHYQYPVQVVHIQDHLAGMDRKRDEKPQSLCQYIISLYSYEGDVIGDPFSGSGAFMKAAFTLKRKYHGSEINPENCAVILERFYRLSDVIPNCAEGYI